MNSWLWLLLTLTCLALCTFLPIRIKNDRIRQLVNWYVLIPVSIVLMFYAYPLGIDVFKRLALTW